MLTQVFPGKPLLQARDLSKFGERKKCRNEIDKAGIYKRTLKKEKCVFRDMHVARALTDGVVHRLRH